MTFAEVIEQDARQLMSSEFSTSANISIRRGDTQTDVELTGVFDRTFTEITDEGLPVTSLKSRITVAENEWFEETGFALRNGEVTFKSEVEIQSLPGVKFRIIDCQSDGQGWATLYLQRVGAGT